MLHFVVRNEQRFPLLLGTNDAFRIFILLSETKSALMIKIYQLHCLFQRFPLLLGTKNALRIFIVLSVTKSALVIKKILNFIAYLQSEILIFLVFVSLGDLTFFFRAT